MCVISKCYKNCDDTATPQSYLCNADTGHKNLLRIKILCYLVFDCRTIKTNSTACNELDKD